MSLLKRNRIFGLVSALIVGLVPVPVAAHLMHKESGTLKIVDNSANFVVAVPVTAFGGVDADRDGMLTPAELGEKRDAIADQFDARFAVADNGPNGRVSGGEGVTWVLSPHTENPAAAMDYVIVMHRVFFDAAPSSPSVETDLFAPGADGAQLSIRASRTVPGEESETFALTPGQPAHTFFNAQAPAPVTSPAPVLAQNAVASAPQENAASEPSNTVLLAILAALAMAIIGFAAWRARHSAAV
ncbi:MAG: hypothetical protein ABJP48_10045 [Erythrobacter sp.]